MGRWGWWLGLLLVLAAGGAPAARAEFDWAPLAARAAAPAAAPDWRAAGPLLERRSSPDGRFRLRALPRPLYTDFRDATLGLADQDFLWPFGFSRERPDGGHTFVIPFLHTASAGAPRERWWLLPLLFTGTNDQGRRYFALFPVGGRIGDILAFDEVDFALFPLWLRTRKGATVSQSWLWPVVGWTDGPGVRKRRVFPFWLSAETERERRTAILWPFWHRQERRADARGGSGSGWLLWPLYGRYVHRDAAGTPRHQSWTCLWPFFSGESGPERERLYAPWPFYRRDLAAGKPEAEADKLQLWPFYGRQRQWHRESSYILWPFWLDGRFVGGDTEATTRGRLLLYWESTGRQRANGHPAWQYRLLWPLWSQDRQGDAATTRVLALWPARRADAIERNYAPFWTLYRQERHGEGVSHELLWGLLQWRRQTPDAALGWSCFPLAEYRRAPAGDFSCNLFKGLAGWGRRGGHGTGRALWFIRW
jgi:hypothetical protein